jgi:N-acetylmuramoyl-L-alanine amidase
MTFRIPRTAALAALALLTSMLPSTSLGAGASRLESVSATSAGEQSRLTLELSQATVHKFFMLDAPRRAVIDLRNTRAASGLKLPSATGAITGVRTGPQPSGGLRIVVELNGNAPAKLTTAAVPGKPGRSQLVLAVRGAGAAAAAVQPAVPPAATAASNAPEVVRPVRVAHAPPESGREVVIAIDAGHGGVDPGAIGRAGTREKDVVLEISRRLAERINREPGMRAVLTRDGDYFLPHRQRMAKARAAKADMFLSVHADSVGNASVSGSSVYILSNKGASDEQARWLAERENAADLKGGISLDDKDDTLATVLLDLSQSASITASMEAAERVLRRLNSVNEVRKPRVQQAGFLVLKSPDIPSMLVETAFISNPGDERRLRQDGYRERLAEAIFEGVHHYFQEYPPEGSRFAALRRAAAPPTAQNLP